MKRPSPPLSAAPPLPLGHPAWILAILTGTVCLLLSAGYRLFDADLWQLLVVGKAIWVRHAIPRTDEWTWVSFGDPQVTSSWAFRALIWPIWSAFGLGGLYALRWLLVLSAFAILWATARRMGGRGFVPIVVLAWCSLVFRLRAEIKPELLAAVLFAIELWILETRRSGGPDRSPAMVPLACVWANVHISYYLCFVVLAAYFADDLAARRRDPRSGALRLPIVAVAAIAAVFLNPFGLRSLVQPIEFALRWRNQEMFRQVAELHAVVWPAHLKDGLPVLVAAWPVLLLARIPRRGVDLAGLLLCAFFTTIALASQRFLGFYAIAAAPFVARDLDAWTGAIRAPAWAAHPFARAALASAACIALGAAEWSRPELPLGIGIDPASFPARAADFLEAHGIRGRAFNHFHLGGYLAYRGWPARDRLPFATTQPENLRPDDRAVYPRVFVDPNAWRTLEGQDRFDYLVLARDQAPGDHLLDMLDADSSWVMVFSDDAAEVLVRRHGAFAAVADSFGYRVLPAGLARRTALVPAAVNDSGLRHAAAAELRRMADASPGNGGANHLLGFLALMDDSLAAARAHFERAIAKKPFLPRVHELLGVIAMREQRPRDALREFERERDLQYEPEGIDVRIGGAHEALGDPAAARRAYRRELSRHPGNAEARAALAHLGG